MKVIREIKSMQEIAEYNRCAGRSIGFVPTMGYLHKGHVSLVERAREENDIVVVSIYVNPTQFLKGEDLNKYPRDFERDYIMCEKSGVDYIFYPGDGEMYNENHYTSVVVSNISDKLEGKFRPGHFTGVATIVYKLFNAVKPHKAYFGQKDAQQVLVIKKMVSDLNYDVDIVVGETIREDSGLAMSSRNSYLSAEYKSQAGEISQALCEAKKLIMSGRVSSTKEVLEYIVRYISTQAPRGEIQYVAITDNTELDDISDIRSYSGEVLISTAIKFGATRLIDNVLFTKN